MLSLTLPRECRIPIAHNLGRGLPEPVDEERDLINVNHNDIIFFRFARLDYVYILPSDLNLYRVHLSVHCKTVYRTPAGHHQVPVKTRCASKFFT